MNELENDIINSVNVLEKGGIILYPTDTIWGIGCDATNAQAIKKIYHLKKREEKKSMIILLTHVDDINNFILNPSQKIIDFIIVQKNPTTAIFENAYNLPAVIINSDASIAIRIAKDIFCERVIQQIKRPIVSTSANISGEASPQNFKQVSDVIKNGVDYIVQHRQNEETIFQTSSIIKLNSLQEIEKIR